MRALATALRADSSHRDVHCDSVIRFLCRRKCEKTCVESFRRDVFAILRKKFNETGSFTLVFVDITRTRANSDS
jgi:hypothetical protein